MLAYAVDVVAGSPLTALSLLGPNPGLGVRFYGIGNELEAPLAVLVVAGTGAGSDRVRAAAVAAGLGGSFLAIGLAAAFVFAAGRFGADVGAAIVLPFGAAVAAAAIAARRRRTALLVVALPFRGPGPARPRRPRSPAPTPTSPARCSTPAASARLGDVAQRRLQLSARSFARPVVFVFLPVVALLVALAVARRDRLRAWLAGAPALRAGLIGAAVATAVGTLANDSGALVLEIGAAYLLVFIGFAWARAALDKPIKDAGSEACSALSDRGRRGAPSPRAVAMIYP